MDEHPGKAKHWPKRTTDDAGGSPASPSQETAAVVQLASSRPSELRRLRICARSLDRIEAELMPIDETWPPGELENLLRKVSPRIDGTCISIRVRRGDDEEKRIARARVYVVNTRDLKSAPFYLLGDPRIEDPLRRRGIHGRLVSLRIITSLLEAPAHRVIWAPGSHAHKGRGFGFRDLTVSEFADAPPELRRIAMNSRCADTGLTTGLLCLDEAAIKHHAQVARTMLERGMMTIAEPSILGEQSVTIRLGGRLSAHLSCSLDFLGF